MCRVRALLLRRPDGRGDFPVALQKNPLKHQESAETVQKLDMKQIDLKSKTGSKGSLSHAPLDGPQLSPDVGTTVDVIHGLLGR
jgi:hypothetical protein